MGVHREERIPNGGGYEAIGLTGVAQVDAFASDVARLLASASDDDPPEDSRDWLTLWLEAFATVELDIGAEPSHHRYQLARLAAYYGFLGLSPPGCVAGHSNLRIGWCIRLLFEEYRR
jgi:hypothetical protein